MNRLSKSITRGIAAAILLAAGPVVARAQTANAGAPGEWLSRYATARSLGLGGAFVAVADDPLGILWNPAGLSAMEQNEVRFENARLFEDTSINGISFAVPGSWLPSFGVTVLSLGSSDFQKTNEMNDALGTFRDVETAYFITASKAFSPKFAIGTNLRLVQQTVEEWSGGGFGVDLGGWYQATPELRLAGSVANLGGPSITLRDAAETYPMQFRGGASYRVFNGRGLINAELDASNGLGAKMHAGGEYWIQPTFALRMGIDDNYGTGGFSLRFAPQYQVDYGVADHPLGMTHRVGVSYRFGGFFASSHAEPAVFSPTGERAVTRISLNARTKADAAEWSLEIVNKSDAVVRRFAGQGRAPAHIEWDGKDETGLPLADGTYRYRLTVKDRDGREMVGPMRSVEIFTAGPQGAVPLLPTPGTPEEKK
jgi:hypothetical protein